MQGTEIGWTDESWNPVHGCSKVSAGCGLGDDGEDVGAGCYAERISLQYGHTEDEWTTENAADNVTMRPDKLEEPYSVKVPSRIFVNSMSDLFHSLVTDEFIRECFAIMRNCPHHIFQILTKRPGRAAHIDLQWPPNVWMGTSVEDERVVERLDLLRSCDADTLFISFEPLIGDVGRVDLRGYDWAIAGGESGPGYRPLENDWVRNIYRQCREQNVPFFFKQGAANQPETDTYFTAFNPEFGVFEQRRSREFPEPNPVVSEARDQLLAADGGSR